VLGLLAALREQHLFAAIYCGELGITVLAGVHRYTVLARVFRRVGAIDVAGLGTLTVGRQLEAAQRPISPSEIDQLSRSAAEGTWRASAEIARAHNWRTLTIAAIGIAAVGASAFASGWFLHGPTVNTFTLELPVEGEKCEARDGGQLCWTPHWTKLPPAQGTGGPR
jgi:hypothetical protein